MDEIYKHFSDLPPLKILERKTRVSAAIMVIGFLALAAVLSLFKFTGNLVVLITGILYPGYMSLCSIHSKEIEDDKQWLSYWVLFSCCNFLDYFLGTLVDLIPFYYTLKLLFIIYLFWPTTRGSLQIYDSILYPKFLSKEEDEYSSHSSRDLKSQSYKQD